MYADLSFALGLELSPRAASAWFGLFLGAAFGAVAFLTRFCLRRALVGPAAERGEARGVWTLALAVAILGTQAAVAAGWVGFDNHRFHAAPLPFLLLIVGGLLFGFGTVLARGCITRLTVLTGGGNLRALAGLFVFAVAAHATLQGVLSPLRTSLAAVTVDVGAVSLADLPGGAWVWTAALAAAALLVALRSGAGRRSLAGAVAMGAMVPVGWVGTGLVLYDDFDPIPLESLSFTAPWADTLFFAIASTLSSPGFGVGLIGGVLAGALVAALAARRFAWEGFESAAQTGRSLAGAALMGVGGVMAGGCTVGAGLSGIPTLSVAALLAFGSIVAGILAAGSVAARAARGSRGLVAAE